MTYKDLIQLSSVEFNINLMGLVRSEIVGSRFFKTEREHSDFDYLVEPDNRFLKVLIELKKEGKTYSISDYAAFHNLLCCGVYVLNVENYGQVHLILTNNFETYYNCFRFANDAKLFKHLDKPIAMEYFNAYCNVKYYEKVLNKPILSV